MTVKTETIREGQILSLGRGASEQSIPYITTPNGTPTDEGDGYNVDGLNPRPVLALLGVTLQTRPEAFDTLVTVVTAVAGDTYTLTVNGAPYAYVALGGDTEKEIVTGIIAVIGAALDAAAPPTHNGDATMTLVGVKGVTYTVAAAVTGTGVMTASKDAGTVSYRLWAYARGRGWHLIPDSARLLITENELERYTVAGLSRLYVEITATDGRVKPLFQPALLET